MDSLRLAIGPEDLQGRIRQRLVGTANTARQVIWSSGSNRLLIHGDSVKARMLRGWLLASVEVETVQTGRGLLEFVFFVGAPKEADGNSAAVRINAATRQATQLAEVFGNDLQRVIWDAVLDSIEVSLRTAGTKFKGQQLTLRGFQADTDGLLVDVLAGEI